MGIFSASHRELAKEAFVCVSKRLTFRPCEASFSDRMRGRLVGYLMDKSPMLARFLQKHLEMFSWIVFVLMVGSTGWALWGGFNYYAYGSCNGLNASGFCLFDPTGKNNQTSALGTCPSTPTTSADLRLSSVTLSDLPRKTDTEANNQIVFIGCYNCEYTREAYPLIQELRKGYKVDYYFAHFPVKEETRYLTAWTLAAYDLDKEKYWKLNDTLFASATTTNGSPELAREVFRAAGYDPDEIQRLAGDKAMTKRVNRLHAEIRDTKIFGTPLIFINGTAYVGPKPMRVYRWAMN